MYDESGDLEDELTIETRSGAELLLKDNGDVAYLLDKAQGSREVSE